MTITQWHKMFRLNNKNTYTHIDLTWAKILGLNMELNESLEFNFLNYSRDKCKTGSECFGQFVKTLYPLRQNQIIKARVKSFLRCLWGALSVRNIKKMIIDEDEDFEAFESRDIIEMTV